MYRFSAPSFLLLVISLLVIRFCFTILVNLKKKFQPPHLQREGKGKRWHLPPGPSGIPFFGNLFQWREARRDQVKFLEYVTLPLTSKDSVVADVDSSLPFRNMGK